MDRSSLEYREALIGLRNFINSELDTMTPNTKEFLPALDAKVRQATIKGLADISRKERLNEIDRSTNDGVSS